MLIRRKNTSFIPDVNVNVFYHRRSNIFHRKINIPLNKVNIARRLRMQRDLIEPCGPRPGSQGSQASFSQDI